MKKVIFTVGLPASGKTTWALLQVKSNPETVKRVNKDDLRAMIDGGKYTSNNEIEINVALNNLVYQYLRPGIDSIVIVDGCNLQKHIDQVKDFIVMELSPTKVEFEVKGFNVSPEICIERNKVRNTGFPEKAIWQILGRYHEEGKFTQYALQSDTIVSWVGFDLDGTIAHYDGWKGPDHIGEPILPMFDVLFEERKKGKIKIFTARACIPEQIPPIRKWLEKHGMADVEITNVKDFGMTKLYDDRCVQVKPNTGILIK